MQFVNPKDFNIEKKTVVKNRQESLKFIDLLKKYLLRIFIAHMLLWFFVMFIFRLDSADGLVKTFIALSIFFSPFYLLTPIYAFCRYKFPQAKDMLLPGSVALLTIYLPSFLHKANLCTGAIGSGINCHIFPSGLWEAYLGFWELSFFFFGAPYLIGAIATVIFFIRLIENIILAIKEEMNKNSNK